ncbi:hypothetical protein D3C72_1868990 [compost metagenome]
MVPRFGNEILLLLIRNGPKKLLQLELPEIRPFSASNRRKAWYLDTSFPFKLINFHLNFDKKTAAVGREILLLLADLLTTFTKSYRYTEASCGGFSSFVRLTIILYVYPSSYSKPLI